jgi:hypothetical protein
LTQFYYLQKVGVTLAHRSGWWLSSGEFGAAVHGRATVDRVHGFFLTKIISKSIIPGSFAKKPLCFSKINPQSMISQLDPWFLKNNSKRVPSLRKIHKNRHETSKFHIFQPQLQI